MMQSKFALALLASIGMAKVTTRSLQAQKEEQLLRFAEFTGKYNKHYTSTEDIEARFNIWSENAAQVALLNAENAGTGVTFKINHTGDLTEEEFSRIKGLKQNNVGNQPDGVGKGGNGGNGGRCQVEPDDIDQSICWVTEGKVHPVKDQGYCGSCWAFAAATVQESIQAIKNETDVVRLSEQEGVDCD